MSAPEIIALAVILFVGIPAMLRNWTAMALVMSYTIGQLWWYFTHLPMPAYPGILCDYGVLVVIFVKAGTFQCLELDKDGHWHAAWRRMLHCVGELSYPDKLIVSLFPVAWACYAVEISDAQRFWFLWSLGLLQLFAAGVEALVEWRRGHVAKPPEAHGPADWFSRQRYAVDEW